MARQIKIYCAVESAVKTEGYSFDVSLVETRMFRWTQQLLTYYSLTFRSFNESILAVVMPLTQRVNIIS